MEKENKFYFIYKTTNLKNGKFYIGMHMTFNLDDGYLGSGKVLRNSIYFHGKENFKREILEFCDDKKCLLKKEQEIVNEELLKDPKCMNLKLGGIGGFNKRVSINGSKKRIYLLENNVEWAKEYKKRVSEGLYESYKNGNRKPIKSFEGKKHTEETKSIIGEKNSIKQKGKNNSQFGTCWITNGVDNKKIKKEETIPDGWKLGRNSEN